MTNDHDPKNLSPATRDYVISAANAALGAVPFAGSLLIELAGNVIPNQRIDRIAKFAESLGNRLENLEQSQVNAHLEDENFTDLMEEGLRQASRSLSDERRDYIAQLIANSISSKDIEFLESKHLLDILGELNDIEIIWLRSHLVQTIGGDEKFRENHAEALAPIFPHFGSPQQEIDKSTLQNSFHEHLARVGLLDRRYRTDMDTNQPEFDRFTGAPEVEGYEITSLGRLLLREIGLTTEAEST